MLRTTAIVLALTAAFVGAQATDMPKPARGLSTHKENTKSTAPNTGAKSKTKMAEICLTDINEQLTVFPPAPAIDEAYQFVANWAAYACSDVSSTGSANAGATPIGQFG